MKVKVNNHVFDKYTRNENLKKIVDWKNVTRMWENSVKHYANNIAVCDSQKYTYAQMDELVSSFRGVLKKEGVKKKSFVGILLPNCADFIKSFLAVTTYGACAVLLPVQLDDKSISGCSRKYSLSAVITCDSLLEKCSSVSSSNPECRIINVSDTGQKLASSDVSSGSPCAVLFTGGTTGKSKGALLSNRAVVMGAKNGCYGYEDVFEERYFLVLPLTHVFGLIRNCLTVFYTGSTLWICKNNKNMFKEMLEYQPTILVFVPALAEMALNISKQFGKNMLGSSVKYIIAGAATVSPYLVREYKKMNISLLPGYGLTESANLVSGNPEYFSHPDSVGYIYPKMRAKVIDGELWIKGPNVMDRYIGEDTRSTFCRRWFKTGDLVRFDENNLMYIVGRKKEIIVLPNGENISPNELETKFNELECIQDSLVSEAEGQLVLEVFPRTAVLTDVENKEKYIKSEIEKVNNRLLSFQRVSKIVIRDKDFVRSPSMKILRNQNEQK